MQLLLHLACMLRTLLHALLRFMGRRPLHSYGGRRKPTTAHKNNRKPDWVVAAVINLRAHQPKQGVVTLAKTFNRLYAATRKVTVSKSYVHDTVRRHRLEIEQERRRIRQRKPVAVAKNAVWGIDMTGKADDAGQMHTILGILDHGSRNALSLGVLANKSSWTLLGHLCLAIGQHDKPKAIRTDNESVFTSRVFSAVLACLGIRHQRTDVGCRWQNGRIERFFGTLKQVLDQWTVENKRQLQDFLDLFRYWYCAVRPHANLNGAPPYESWNGIDPHQSKKSKLVKWFAAWDGLLTGYVIKRE